MPVQSKRTAAAGVAAGVAAFASRGSFVPSVTVAVAGVQHRPSRVQAEASTVSAATVTVAATAWTTSPLQAVGAASLVAALATASKGTQRSLRITRGDASRKARQLQKDEGRPVDISFEKLVAYHEAGHALVATLLPHHDEVNKVTVTPTVTSAGQTWYSPSSDDQSMDMQNHFQEQIAGCLAGKAAEEVVFDHESVGAARDLFQVHHLIRGMLQTQYGMSSLGTSGSKFSEDIAAKIDEISDRGYEMAVEICTTHRAVLDRLAEELCETPSMPGSRVREICEEMGVKVPEKNGPPPGLRML